MPPNGDHNIFAIGRELDQLTEIALGITQIGNHVVTVGTFLEPVNGSSHFPVLGRRGLARRIAQMGGRCNFLVMLCIGWPVAVIEDVSDGTLGEGGVVCRRRGRGRACHESRGQAVFPAGRRYGHGGFASSAPDRFLSPLELDEHGSEPGPCVNRRGTRCSDKGFLPVSVAAYLELLDWTAHQTMPGKRGSTPSDAAPILERLQVTGLRWMEAEIYM
jgi:hypothetical protein